MKKKIKSILPWVFMSEKIFRLYVKSNKYVQKGNKLLACFISNKIYKKYKCIISPYAIISKGIIFPHPLGIVIGDGVVIGENCIIYQNVTIGRKNNDIPEYPKIGNNVKIYCNSTIIGNIKIGNNAIIGCNSVVLRDVKDGETVAGIVK